MGILFTFISHLLVVVIAVVVFVSVPLLLQREQFPTVLLPYNNLRRWPLRAPTCSSRPEERRRDVKSEGPEVRGKSETFTTPGGWECLFGPLWVVCIYTAVRSETTSTERGPHTQLDKLISSSSEFWPLGRRFIVVFWWWWWVDKCRRKVGAQEE